MLFVDSWVNYSVVELKKRNVFASAYFIRLGWKIKSCNFLRLESGPYIDSATMIHFRI